MHLNSLLIVLAQISHRAVIKGNKLGKAITALVWYLQETTGTRGFSQGHTGRILSNSRMEMKRLVRETVTFFTADFLEVHF